MTQDCGSAQQYPSREFASTHWSMVLQAAQPGTAAADAALALLCQRYWTPLYAYIRRRVGNEHAAQDLTQEFFARLLEKNYVQQADPQRGRFRTFLLSACQHFLANQWRDSRAQKRGGGRSPLRLEFDSFHPEASSLADDALTPEQAFEREWATTLLGRVMVRLEQEQADLGKAAQFACLKHFLASNRTAGGYDTAAAQLGITEAAARMAASRLRGRYRELLRDEIAQTVASPEAVEQEISDLFRAFAHG